MFGLVAALFQWWLQQELERVRSDSMVPSLNQLRGTGCSFRCTGPTSLFCVTGVSEHGGAQPS